MSKQKYRQYSNKDFYRGLFLLFLSAFFIVALYCYKNYYSVPKLIYKQKKTSYSLKYGSKDKKYLDDIINKKISDN